MRVLLIASSPSINRGPRNASMATAGGGATTHPKRPAVRFASERISRTPMLSADCRDHLALLRTRLISVRVRPRGRPAYGTDTVFHSKVFAPRLCRPVGDDDHSAVRVVILQSSHDPRGAIARSYWPYMSCATVAATSPRTLAAAGQWSEIADAVLRPLTRGFTFWPALSGRDPAVFNRLIYEA